MDQVAQDIQPFILLQKTGAAREMARASAFGVIIRSLRILAAHVGGIEGSLPLGIGLFAGNDSVDLFQRNNLNEGDLVQLGVVQSQNDMLGILNHGSLGDSVAFCRVSHACGPVQSLAGEDRFVHVVPGEKLRRSEEHTSELQSRI